MKKNLIAMMFALVGATGYGQYCTVSTTFGACGLDEYISNVTVGSLNNTSGCNLPYTDFTTLGSVPVIGIGASTPITVTVSGWFDNTDRVTVWIDLNNDLVFGAGESFDLNQTPGGVQGGSVLYFGNITLPTGLTPTTTTMRVALGYGLGNPQPACGAVNYGDREDYLVTIAPPFELVMSSPLGAGSLQVNINNGTPNAPYFMAVALAAGAFPNGWFFGVDIPLNDLVNEYIAGPPFIGLLDASGNFQFGPFPGLPSGLTLYAVAVDQLFTPISRATNPVAYTIP